MHYWNPRNDFSQAGLDIYFFISFPSQGTLTFHRVGVYFFVIICHGKIKNAHFMRFIATFTLVRVPSRAFFMQTAQIKEKPPKALILLGFQAVFLLLSLTAKCDYQGIF